MTTKLVMGIFMAVAAAFLPSSAFAEGSVKVECWGRCDLVTLGQVCDTYVPNSFPVSIACDDTGVGAGADRACGSATCRPFGTIVRSDRVSNYCDDGGGYDAIVTCRVLGSLQESAVPKADDGAGELESE